jgi:hypothetical protein
MRLQRSAIIFGSFLAVILCSLAALAQEATATLNGRVTDPSGLPVAGAKVQAVNVNTNVPYSAETNDAGRYDLPTLPPGAYRMSVEKNGFEQIVKPGISLHVSDIVAINFALQVGSVTQSVTVTGGTPIVETTTSALGGIVDAQQVRELPLNGRDWTQLATLEPGVTSDSSLQPTAAGSTGLGEFARGNRGFGAQLAVNGSRPEQNNYRVDGVSVNDYVNGGPGTALGATLGVDAIQEFSLLSSNYSAENGRTSGGIVNAITRSGTNQFHGDVFWFLRDTGVDARNYFDPTLPPFHRNQFGAAAGGPIKKDKTFIFADYEGFRQTKGVTSVDVVPSQNARNGILTSGTVTVNPLVLPFLALWPLPNGPVSGDTGTYNFTGIQVFSEDFVSARVDFTGFRRMIVFLAATNSINLRLVHLTLWATSLTDLLRTDSSSPSKRAMYLLRNSSIPYESVLTGIMR